MDRILFAIGISLSGLCLASAASASPTSITLRPGYWTAAEAQPILQKTLTIRLDPDLSGLSKNELRSVNLLLKAGKLFHQLYLEQLHHQALTAKTRLNQLDKTLKSPAVTQNLLKLFRIFKEPVATTLTNEHMPFLPVDNTTPGKNVYPWDIDKATLDKAMAAHPALRAAILNPRSVVRRTNPEQLNKDLRTLHDYPGLALLHPGLTKTLRLLRKQPAKLPFYAVPYSVAYAPVLIKIYELLGAAADAIDDSDRDFADYLRARARDLLSDNYESGDAAWVRGAFHRLNAQIGSFETYDDQLYGVKTFFGLSLLLHNEVQSARLKQALANIQALEDTLPYDSHKRVQQDIPLGVYDVIADFGQARGTNTASILPNEARYVRKYGRTILLRYNIMTNPRLFADTKAVWDKVVAPAHRNDLTMQGMVDRTLWHEIGHYLGVDMTSDGRTLDQALGRYASLLEELKADLVSLYAGPELKKTGHYDNQELRALYAGGIDRTLQAVHPHIDQPYAAMELMQMDYFLTHGVLQFDRQADRLNINYTSYPQTIKAMLRQVLALQRAGDPDKARTFIDKYMTWDDKVQGAITARVRAATTYRYRLIDYGVLKNK